MTTKVVILGGGFGGVYAALQFDRSRRADLEITLISEDNFFLFTPMLSEVATGSVDTPHIVNPLRRLFKRVRFVEATVKHVELEKRNAEVELVSGDHLDLNYDHLIIALGSVPNYFNLPGVEEHSLPLKTLLDAIRLRNQIIQTLEEADVTKAEARKRLLTFVVTGGGLSGVEVTGDLLDFVRSASSAYPTISEDDFRVVLVEGGPRLMPELSTSLGDFAKRTLEERGVEVKLNALVKGASADSLELETGEVLQTHNHIWTAGVAPTPFIRGLGIPLEKGRLPTDESMRVRAQVNVWAVGDVARIPNGKGGFHPPTAQHAIREGRQVAKNVMQVVQGQSPTPFLFGGLGMLTAIGHRKGAGEIFGIRVSGFLAWFLWRSYYLYRLPRLEKKIRVLLDWTLDLVFPRDIVQLKLSGR